MTPKKKKGTDHPSNIMLMSVARHDNLHDLFRLRTWEQIIDALCMFFQLREVPQPRIGAESYASLARRFADMSGEEIRERLHSIFGAREPQRVVQVMEHISWKKRRYLGLHTRPRQQRKKAA